MSKTFFVAPATNRTESQRFTKFGRDARTTVKNTDNKQNFMYSLSIRDKRVEKYYREGEDYHHWAFHSRMFDNDLKNSISLLFTSFLEKNTTKDELQHAIGQYVSSEERIFERRKTLLSVLYMVSIGGFDEIIRNDPIFLEILKGFIIFENIYKNKFGHTCPVYSLEKLVQGDIPDEKNPELFRKLREIFDFRNVIVNTVLFIGELESQIPELEQKVPNTVPTFGTAIQPQNVGFMTAKMQHNSRFVASFTRNWQKYPMSFSDCFAEITKYIEKGGNIYASDELSAFLSNIVVSQNVTFWVETFFAMLCPQALETLFKTQNIKNQEKKELIENNLHNFLNFLKVMGSPLEPTVIQAKETTQWLIKHVSYHPLGAFDNKHFPICEKLNILSNDLMQPQNIRTIAKVMVDEMKKFDIKKIVTKACSDIFKRSLNYGILGFIGLHRFLYNEVSGEYKIALYNIVKEKLNIAPMIQSLFTNFCQDFLGDFNSSSNPTFFIKFIDTLKLKRKELEEILENKSKESKNLKRHISELRKKPLPTGKRFNPEVREISNQIETLTNECVVLEKKIALIFSTLTEVEQVIIDSAIDMFSLSLNSNYSCTDSSHQSILTNFVKKMMECVKNFHGLSSFPIFDESFVAACNENIKKVKKNNARTMDFLGKEFIPLCILMSQKMTESKNTKLENIRIMAVSMIVMTVANIQATEEDGTVDSDFVKDCAEEIFRSFFGYVRSDIKTLAFEFHEITSQVQADQDADTLFTIETTLRNYPKTKKHLIANFESLSFLSSSMIKVNKFLADVATGKIGQTV
jgi:hypothetical protein